MTDLTQQMMRAIDGALHDPFFRMLNRDVQDELIAAFQAWIDSRIAEQKPK